MIKHALNCTVNPVRDLRGTKIVTFLKERRDEEILSLFEGGHL